MTNEWWAGGATWAERMASEIERRIPPGCKHESAIEALRNIALVRRHAAISPEKTTICITLAMAHWKDFMLWDDAMRGEKSGAGSSKGGIKSGKAKTGKAAEWQRKIRPSVMRMLAAGKTDSNIAALLASETRTRKGPARSVRAVSGFVAAVRKAKPKK